MSFRKHQVSLAIVATEWRLHFAATVKGRIAPTLSGEPVRRCNRLHTVHFRLVKKRPVPAADADGHFHFPTPMPGNELQATFLGMDTVSRDISFLIPPKAADLEQYRQMNKDDAPGTVVTGVRRR